MPILLFITKPIYVLLGFSFFAFSVQLYFYIRYYFEIAKKHRRERNNNELESALPPVSVIICAKNESENIKKFLPSILEQDYPDYEVIVINDGALLMDGTPDQIFAQRDTLNEVGLEVPQCAELIHNLRAAGINILGDTISSPEVCADILQKAFNARQN